MNPMNVDRQAFGRALRRFISNVPVAKLRQFLRWSRTGRFDSWDGAVDYRANLRHITVPTLVVAAAADRLAPPHMVRLGYEHIGSSRKAYREFAASEGYAADYGHMDLVFGRHAPEEVFGAIASWIEEEVAPVSRRPFGLPRWWSDRLDEANGVLRRLLRGRPGW